MALKMSQTKLADLSGITQSALSKIKAGKGNPEAKTLIALCAALDVELVLVPRRISGMSPIWLTLISAVAVPQSRSCRCGMNFSSLMATNIPNVLHDMSFGYRTLSRGVGRCALVGPRLYHRAVGCGAELT
jgi:DNA-binding XRE family transcriptional regulator